MIEIKSYGKARTGNVSSGGGSFSNISGGAINTQWVEDNFVSKAFFNQLFTVHDAFSSYGLVSPNNTSTAIGSIEANYGLWTYSFISALGRNTSGSGGSSGGGGASYLGELDDVSLSNPTNGQALVYDSATGLWKNGTVQGGGGGGTGTVTSVAMSVPTGFSISGSPITSSGTLALSFASGYKLPTTSKQTQWDYAYTNSNTLLTYFNASGYALSAVQANSANSATSAGKLSTTNKTAWGQQYWTNGGVPTSISGDMSNVGNVTTGSSGGALSGFYALEMNTEGNLSSSGGYIDFHYNGSSADYTSRIIEDANGRIFVEAENGLRIGYGIIKWDSTNNCLMIERYDGTACDIYATGGVSALGFHNGSSSMDTMTFTYLNVDQNLHVGQYEIKLNGSTLRLTGPSSIQFFGTNLYFTPDGSLHAPKVYLSSNTYLFVDGSTLKFYNGSAEKSVIVT